MGKKVSKNKSAVIAVMLMIAIIIAGVFAFMTATDTKDNVFTIGKVKAELWEDFDTDGDGIAESVNATTKSAEYEGVVMPGDRVIKAPYVKNTGTNPEYIFATVAIPYADETDVYDYGDGAAVAETEKNIIIRSYAFQMVDGKTVDEIWEEYALDVDGDANTLNAIDRSTAIQLFDVSSGTDGSTDGFNETNWTVLNDGEPVVSDDGYEYYVLKYNTTLAAGASTEKMFNFATLSEEIGEEVVDNGLVTLNFYSTPDRYTDVSSMDLSDAEIVFTANVPKGSPVELPDLPQDIKDKAYSRNSSGNIVDGYNLNWQDYSTGEIGYSGMIADENRNFVITYDNMDLVNLIPEQYYVYQPFSSGVRFYGIHKDYFYDEDGNVLHDPNLKYSVIVPSSITIPSVSTQELEQTYVMEYGGDSAKYYKTNVGYIASPICIPNRTYTVVRAELYVRMIMSIEDFATTIGEEVAPFNGTYTEMKLSNIYDIKFDTVVFEPIQTIHIKGTTTTGFIEPDGGCSGGRGEYPYTVDNTIFSYGVKETRYDIDQNKTNVTLPPTITGMTAFCCNEEDCILPPSVKNGLTYSADDAQFLMFNSTSSRSITSENIDGIDIRYCSNLVELNCPNVKRIVLGETTPIVNSDGLRNCPELEDVYFFGTLNRWNNYCGTSIYQPERITVHYFTNSQWNLAQWSESAQAFVAIS